MFGSQLRVFLLLSLILILVTMVSDAKHGRSRARRPSQWRPPRLRLPPRGSRPPRRPRPGRGNSHSHSKSDSDSMDTESTDSTDTESHPNERPNIEDWLSNLPDWFKNLIRLDELIPDCEGSGDPDSNWYMVTRTCIRFGFKNSYLTDQDNEFMGIFQI